MKENIHPTPGRTLSDLNLQEIERKFLVSGNSYKTDATEQYKIVQGYLNSSAERNVRIRTQDDRGFITVKGPSSSDGTTRFEWEKEIPLIEAEALLELCELATIEKTRYVVNYGHHVVEVDEFAGVNEGLVLAEIELRSPDENFIKPDWLAEEVTGNDRYYNAQLSKNPFCVWGSAGLFSAQ